jgi:hypothetical protein
LPHELAELPQIFHGVTESTPRQEQSLWDSWPLLLAFFGLVTSSGCCGAQRVARGLTFSGVD